MGRFDPELWVKGEAEGKAAAGVVGGSLGYWRKSLDLGTKSMLIASNNNPERCPIHGSVAFHPYWSPQIQIIWFELSLDSAQWDRKKRGRGRRIIHRKENRERDRGKKGIGEEKDMRDYSLSKTHIYSIKCWECNTFRSTAAKPKILPDIKAGTWKRISHF